MCMIIFIIQTIKKINFIHLKPDFIRKQIGVVAQEPVLFTECIKDNIQYLKHVDNDCSSNSFDVDELYRICNEANAHDFIMDFPDGYNTQIGEGGTNLSSGQE